MSYRGFTLPSHTSKAVWFPAGWQKHEEISVFSQATSQWNGSCVQQRLHKYFTHTKLKYRKLSCALAHLDEQWKKGWNLQTPWKSQIHTGNVIWSNFKNLPKRKTLKGPKPSQSPAGSSELPVFRVAQLSFDKFLPTDLMEICQYFAVMASECWSCPAREYKTHSVFIESAWFWPLHHH